MEQPVPEQLSPEQIRDLSVEALDSLKAENVVVLDVSAQASFTDYMIFASGNSNRHVSAIADSVLEVAERQSIEVLGVEGQDVSEWILVDLGDAIVHIMQPDIRQYYELEKLWSEELSTE